MPAYARHELVAEGEFGFYHCVTRCVRRAFLCGYDALSQKSFEHRKHWVRDRLQEQAAVFGIDVCGYAVMRTSNEWSQEAAARHEVALSEWQGCSG